MKNGKKFRLFVTETDKKCPECGWEVGSLLGFGVSKKDARKRFWELTGGNSYGLCVNCICDILLGGGYYIIKEK